MDFSIRVGVKKLSAKVGSSVSLPFYATEGAAGMDLCACLEEEIIVKPLERVQVPTGLAIKIPSHVVGLVFPRSGNAWRLGMTLSNAVGVIDSDYTGEIRVLITNLDPERPFIVKPGDRIAQLVFVPVLSARLELVEELEETERGSGGFGSTGR
ncbi:dUTP diphosphatase [Syntrophothermus lipocalidus]|uniref:Deoxyuridine 5'-triphosphate nucleotidohydrolase n=1 Tax=Syntrophothermus lipocalidus (strain DSM 12680 / TGB-C1) TaxID=643648 RepID=D7CM59_SYNLT|nr:dUTP diphosphatase [Syntrophothermus lipocalidus]ADI01794.1 deoxyuridine 5'-triphosphate nucleotidohydrolase Dut [Syntrophothermus lipocalidus DSM 12680]